MKYNVLMRKAWTFLILGIWVTILPYSGFPYSWKDTLGVLTGLLIIGLSCLMYRDSKIEEAGIEEKNFDTFLENSDFTENDTNELN